MGKMRMQRKGSVLDNRGQGRESGGVERWARPLTLREAMLALQRAASAGSGAGASQEEPNLQGAVSLKEG